MPARSIGTATISFGLVAIPTKLYTTSETSHDISFNMLHAKDGARLKQQYICTCCNEVVDRSDTVKGYEHAKGQYVSFTEDEIKALDATATHEIALQEFVPATQIDPLYVEKSYYLGPDKGGERAYRLIRDALVNAGLVGIASYSARGKQYIVCVRPYQDGLLLHQLRYAAEVKAWSEISMPDLPEPKAPEAQLAALLVESLAVKTFDPTKYTDDVQARMQTMIDQKVAGEEMSAPVPTVHGKLSDLMAALQASLAKPNAPAPHTLERPQPPKGSKPPKGKQPKV
jgi:DNA end-binding protein Ku